MVTKPDVPADGKYEVLSLSVCQTKAASIGKSYIGKRQSDQRGPRGSPGKFLAAHFKKVASVIVGDPNIVFKKRTQSLMLADVILKTIP